MKSENQQNNPWYIYTEDTYGVNGLLEYTSKETLIEDIKSTGYLESVEIEDISAEVKNEIDNLIHLFRTNSIGHVEFEEQLLEIFIANESCIDTMHIEDFERLCKGKSEFGKMTIVYFCEENEMDVVDEIPEELKKDFKLFFDTAEETWIG